MIKKIKIPKKYRFFIDKAAVERFLAKNKFFGAGDIEIKEITEDSILMDNVSKVFIRYRISLDKKEDKFLHLLHRFGGTDIIEFKILEYLQNSGYLGFFLLPRPLFYFKKEKFILYEDVSGEPIYILPKEEILSLLEKRTDLLAGFLISLHKTKPPAKKYNIKNDEIEAKKFEKEFLKFLPRFKNLIKETVSGILKGKRFYLKNIPSSFFIHNDFTFGNLIWQREKDTFGLIDFSESCYYDPLADVGIFLAQMDYLNFLTGKEKLIEKIQEKFTRKYVDLFKKKFPIETGEFLKDYQKRLFLHRAWGDLQNAVFVLAAQEKKQNLEGCLWFIKKANNLLEDE